MYLQLFQRSCWLSHHFLGCCPWVTSPRRSLVTIATQSLGSKVPSHLLVILHPASSSLLSAALGDRQAYGSLSFQVSKPAHKFRACSKGTSQCGHSLFTPSLVASWSSLWKPWQSACVKKPGAPPFPASSGFQGILLSG